MTPGVSFIFVSLLFICTAHSAEKGYMAMHSAERLRDNSQPSLIENMGKLLMTWIRDFASHPSEANKKYDQRGSAPPVTPAEKNRIITLMEQQFPER